MATLQERLIEEYKTAMKAGDALRRDTLRLLRSALHLTEVEKRGPLTEEEALEVLMRQAKTRKESIELFAKGGRQDLVDHESAELAIIESYLPQQMSRQEIEEIVQRVIAELGVSGKNALGPVMSRLMPLVKGRADGKVVNEVVRSLLN